jgi:transketolase N-terminal domain/subunit
MRFEFHRHPCHPESKCAFPLVFVRVGCKARQMIETKEASVETLVGIANQLRIHSINATTAAGSGHPTSSMSAADIVAALFFGHMRYYPNEPKHHNNDRFILSKGHAAPVLYAAWAENGFIPVNELLRLRELTSDLEGHPTPRLPFVDVSTGSLGQGLSVGVGMALSARLDNLDFRTYVLLGDGECAEGSVWEAAALAGIYTLNNLVAIVDVNRLGQSQATAYGHDLKAYEARFKAFGWRTEVIDGHDMEEILEVLAASHSFRTKTAGTAKRYPGKKRRAPSLNSSRKPPQASASTSNRLRIFPPPTLRRRQAIRRSITPWDRWSPLAKPTAMPSPASANQTSASLRWMATQKTPHFQNAS